MKEVSEQTRAELADYAHKAWAGWMDYLFSKCEKWGNYEGLYIPAVFVQRWERQLATDFHSLPANEQKSDYDEADKMIEIMLRN